VGKQPGRPMAGRRARYAEPMQGPLAARLLGQLTFAPGVAVCPGCAASRLKAERSDVMWAIRKLTASGSILCLFDTCSACGQEDLLARAREARRSA
jgi:hypothetical protein